MDFANRLNYAFKTITKEDGTEYTPEDIQSATNKAVTSSYVWRLRSGKADNPSIIVVKVLSDFFDVKPSYFLDDPEEEGGPITQSLNQIALRSGSLEDADRALILQMIDHIKHVRATLARPHDSEDQ